MKLSQLRKFQKPIAILLSFAIMISCFVLPGTVMASSSEIDYWDGTTSKPAKGSGSLNDPYLVETAEEFAYMITVAHGGDNWEQNSVYKLMNDIYLNDVDKIDWMTGEVEKGYVPNQWTPSYFSGIIQGNGHMVYGLYIERNPDAYTENWSGDKAAALISENWYSKWLTINDMGMDCVYINSGNCSGVFLGCTNGIDKTQINFNGCYIGDNVTVTGFAAGGFVGGGYGSKAYIRIKNCASLATGFFDNGRNLTGAMLGDLWGVANEEVDNCYAVTKLFGNGTPTGSFTNNYSNVKNDTATVLSFANMQGSDVLTNPNKMPNLGGAFTPTASFPLPSKIYDAMVAEKEDVLSIWTGEKIAPTKGRGTTADPFLIETAEEFAYMFMVAHGGDGWEKNAVYKLVNDIYLNDVNKINWTTGKPVEGYTPNTWEPTYFSGIIQGNGHTVYGLYIERNPEEYTEKWGETSGAALIAENWSNKWIWINNMGMDYVYVNSPNVSSVFVAGLNNGNSGSNQLEIDGCYIGSNVTVKGFAAGGFLGGGFGTRAYIKIKNCASFTTGFFDNGREKSGAMLGDVWGVADDEIDNCFAVSKIHGNNPPTGSLTNNYSAVQSGNGVKKLDVEDMKGTDATTSATKMANLGPKFIATEDFPLPAAFYGTLIEADQSVGKIWDGKTTFVTNGEGTKEAPYEIATAEQLAYVVSTGGGAHYKLTADIYLNDVNKIDWATGTPEEGYVPNEWYKDVFFSGSIDGNGHVVYGLYYNSDEAKAWSFVGFGLIPKVGDKTVSLKNLGIDKAYINAPGAVGGLFGSNANGVAEAEQCFVGADVTLCGYETGAFLGLSTGEFHFNNCYSQANTVRGIQGDNACDIGLLGEFYVYPSGNPAVSKSYVTNCYNSKSGGSTKKAPGYYVNVYTAENSLFGTNVTSENMQGTVFTGNKMALTDAFLATETYPVLKVFTNETEWNGLAHALTKGDGASPETAFEISDAGQLAYVIATDGGQKHYKLTNDIFINDIEKIDWSTGNVKDGTTDSPIAWFRGENANGEVYASAFGAALQFQGAFDGCGHTVYGVLSANDGKSTVGGLFPAAVNSTIKNLKIAYSYVAGGRFAGAVAGYMGGTLENVVVDDTVYVYGYESVNHESSAVGGLVGYTNYITLKNCAFTGHISFSNQVNHKYSLVGTSWGSNVVAENCFGAGLQPFTVSTPTKHFGTKAEAEAYFKALYVATNVYTDSYANGNVVNYTYGDSKTRGTCTPFAFIKLENAAMQGESALNNMSGLDKKLWRVTEGYPTLKKFSVANGDIDDDGQMSTKLDVIALRKGLIDKNSDDDVNGDGSVNICDLVKVCLENPVHTDTDGVFELREWNGIEDLIVFYMMSDTASQFAASQLQKTATQKGDSVYVRGGISYAKNQLVFCIDASMEPAEYNTQVVGSNIIISAGSKNALNCAVDSFGKNYTDSTFPLVKGVSEYDAEITLSSGNTYTHSWSDEFYGNSLDRNNWVNSTGNTKMSGFKDLKLLDTEEAVFVKNGKLTLRAMEYTDPKDANIKYAVPASVHSQGTMEYRYGYAEIYAKVPFKLGTWPSFWAQSTATLGGRKCFEYGVEVDIFEIFGNVNTVVPNIHKWYHTYNYNEIHGVSTDTEKGHTQLSRKDVYKFTNYANLSNEFHLYGFEWTPTEISMYVDGYLYETIDIVNSYDLYEDMSGFQDPLFLIFNNHLFTPESSWVPEISKGDKNYITGLEEQNLPADYEIDWLRVYQNSKVQGTELFTKVK